VGNSGLTLEFSQQLMYADKRRKEAPSLGLDGSKSQGAKKKTPMAALSIEEQSSKNTESRLTTMEKRQAALARKELGKSFLGSFDLSH
jgi:hypothetical protein